MRLPLLISASLLVIAVGPGGCAASRALERAESLAAESSRGAEGGDVQAALATAWQALELREAHLKPDHALVIESLEQVAGLLSATGQLDRAADLLQRAKRARSSSLGAEHPSIGKLLNDLGNLRYSQGDYKWAESLYRQGLAVREKALGENHRQVSDSLDDLAWLLKTTGRFEEARLLHQRALSIREACLGPDHPDTAQVLANLGDLYFRTGAYEKSRQLQQRALRIREAHFGPNHRKVAISLNNLGELLRETGDPVAARALYERSLAIKERLLGPEHPSVAVNLNNLGLLAATTGDPDTARRLWERALSIREKSLGADHPRVGYSLNNLGQLLTESGHPEQALPLLARAARILANKLSAEHPMLAHVHNSQGLAYARLGRIGPARERFERALIIWEKALGSEHPDLAEPLSNLGELHRTAGFVERAIAAHERALALRIKALGPHHPAVADSLLKLALSADRGADPARAQAWIGRALELTEKYVMPLLDAAPERQRIGLVRAHRSILDGYLEFGGPEPDSPAVYRAVLRWKAAAFLSLTTQRDLQRSATDDKTRMRLSALQDVRRELASLFFGPASADPEKRLERIRALTGKKEGLERELASLPLPAPAHGTDDPLARLCSTLKEDQVLVDYLRVEQLSGTALTEPRYLAFVIASDCKPKRYDLGPAATIEREVSIWRRLLASSSSTERVRRAGVRLRRMIWDPLFERLEGKTRVRVIPDGALQAVPFGALPRPGGDGFLIEGLTFEYAVSARQGLAESKPEGDKALVVGGVSYQARNLPGPALDSVGRRAPKALSGLFPLPPLPASLLESRAVASLLPGATMLTGAEASEGRIKREMPGKRLVHLATHGFFATGKLRSALIGPLAGSEVVGYNPLLLSGVVLAGANGKLLDPDGEDGVLTAEEVVSLDLSGVQLVVLSACQTGLGEVVAGEGVLGLRRAFARAGARGLVLSLWRVSDEDTRELIGAFYRALVQAEPAAALRKAKLDWLTRRRQQGLSLHPRLWAALVLSAG